VLSQHETRALLTSLVLLAFTGRGWAEPVEVKTHPPNRAPPDHTILLLDGTGKPLDGAEVVVHFEPKSSAHKGDPPVESFKGARRLRHDSGLRGEQGWAEIRHKTTAPRGLICRRRSTRSGSCCR